MEHHTLWFYMENIGKKKIYIYIYGKYGGLLGKYRTYMVIYGCLPSGEQTVC